MPPSAADETGRFSLLASRTDNGIWWPEKTYTGAAQCGTGLGQCVPRLAGPDHWTGQGVAFQISAAYSAIVRSLENLPELVPVTLRYIDPSYTIRSVPADAADAILCDLFARNAVHAAMAGKTGLVVGLIHDQFVHVPIEMLTAHTKRMDPAGMHWHAVLAATGQPAAFW